MKYPSIFESGWFVFSIVLTFIIEVGIILYFYIAIRHLREMKSNHIDRITYLKKNVVKE